MYREVIFEITSSIPINTLSKTFTENKSILKLDDSYPNGKQWLPRRWKESGMNFVTFLYNLKIKLEPQFFGTEPEEPQ